MDVTDNTNVTDVKGVTHETNVTDDVDVMHGSDVTDIVADVTDDVTKQSDVMDTKI